MAMDIIDEESTKFYLLCSSSLLFCGLLLSLALLGEMGLGI
jgi:hypothetical protein